jgi:hypothetical protein
MTLLRSVFCLLLAVVALGVATPQQALAQVPPGTTRTGTFVWDGERWEPIEPVPAVPVQSLAVVSITIEPPALPVYEQPPCPAPDLMWTPGHWDYDPVDGYFWVPGAWVPAPYVGALWTPGYWGWSGGQYAFRAGYWGPHIGYYGGVSYGGGYMGIGFAGGTWNGGVFAYNTAVVHVNTTVVTNVYVNTTIVQQTTIVNVHNVSYSGGPNGVQHQPTADEQIAEHDQHVPPTTFQQQHIAAAKADKSSFVKNNGGHPTNLAVAKPLAEEKHTAPAGFKPPPAKPASELAKAQAPPATVAAAKEATTKNAAIKAPPAKTEAKTEAKPAPTPAAKPAAKPMPKAEATPAAKPAPKAEMKPAAKPAPKAEAKPAPKAETKPEAKPAAKPAPKPAAKPAPKPAAKPKPEDDKK